jgi:hypothetical protein
MARHRKDYAGERHTEKVTLQFTPSQREMLERDAHEAGATLSQHGRELCLRRSARAPVLVGTQRSPEEKRALVKELTKIGNNLNQLTHLAQIHKTVPQHNVLMETTDLVKTAIRNVIGG